MDTETDFRIQTLETALRSAAVMLRSAADRAASGQRPDPDALRAAARDADEIAGRPDPR
jgi:hypothetical protein